MEILEWIHTIDAQILLFIQQYLRSDMVTWFWKGITFLGDGGWFWIVLALVLLISPKTRKAGVTAALALAYLCLICMCSCILQNVSWKAGESCNYSCCSDWSVQTLCGGSLSYRCSGRSVDRMGQRSSRCISYCLLGKKKNKGRVILR